ncbi:hypothetical protein DEIPH_ctg036orf0014 [Deinococcus phoenicis]|uniref:Uncharacterized protein n=1 Tax=Deinococcus phoenicis TaxID=1476583 RepID=A0A016QNM7_9DEIO|nr:hypothetical protein [Deinococcus phoenicis]EYB67561.1 hypothetical protein DEIPH_ctg036orf0014 [Deinococcus phoenicis]
MPVTRLLLPLLLAGAALAGGGASVWQVLNADGIPRPAAHVRPARPCPPLRLPADWDVRAQAYADVTGDGTPECVLAVWRPWRDWPTRRWESRPSPIVANRDARGDSAHVLVLKPRPDGTFRPLWGGSALYRPVTALTVLPGGHLVTLESTYARGRDSASTALSEWSWTGFGFRLERRVPLGARHLAADGAGWPAVR